MRCASGIEAETPTRCTFDLWTATCPLPKRTDYRYYRKIHGPDARSLAYVTAYATVSTR